jgi:uncharacterized protein YggE
MRQAMATRAMADATPIETGELTVNAMVRARWLFVSGR